MTSYRSFNNFVGTEIMESQLFENSQMEHKNVNYTPSYGNNKFNASLFPVLGKKKKVGKQNNNQVFFNFMFFKFFYDILF